MDFAVPVTSGPFEGRDERPVFSDVVGRSADRLVKLLDERAVGLLDPHAETGRPRVAPGATVDVRDDHQQLVVRRHRRTENGEAPGWQGATTEDIGNM